MSMRSIAIASTCAFGVSAGSLGNILATGHGDHAASFGGQHMEQQFTMYRHLPVGDDALQREGWHKHTSGGCDPHLGYAWTRESDGQTKHNPTVLYTTAGGQPAGVGVIMIGYHGKAPLAAEQAKWATTDPVLGPRGDSNIAHVDVAFRAGDILCSGETDNAAIGTTVIVNPKGGDNTYQIPLTDEEVKAAGWHRGSCFDGMGFHWFLDTSKANGEMSWKAGNLFPVAAMYHEGAINAIFFASQNDQVSIPVFKSNYWEPVALSNRQVCFNLCDDECDWEGNDKWSTMHFYFQDHEEVHCAEDLKCGLNWPAPRGNCCEERRAVEVV